MVSRSIGRVLAIIQTLGAAAVTSSCDAIVGVGVSMSVRRRPRYVPWPDTVVGGPIWR
jgi:hypothetical protein